MRGLLPVVARVIWRPEVTAEEVAQTEARQFFRECSHKMLRWKLGRAPSRATIEVLRFMNVLDYKLTYQGTDKQLTQAENRYLL